MLAVLGSTGAVPAVVSTVRLFWTPVTRGLATFTVMLAVRSVPLTAPSTVNVPLL